MALKGSDIKAQGKLPKKRGPGSLSVRHSVL